MRESVYISHRSEFLVKKIINPKIKSPNHTQKSNVKTLVSTHPRSAPISPPSILKALVPNSLHLFSVQHFQKDPAPLQWSSSPIPHSPKTSRQQLLQARRRRPEILLPQAGRRQSQQCEEGVREAPLGRRVDFLAVPGGVRVAD